VLLLCIFKAEAHVNPSDTKLLNVCSVMSMFDVNFLIPSLKILYFLKLVNNLCFYAEGSVRRYILDLWRIK
jgi:hypothetical protein